MLESSVGANGASDATAAGTLVAAPRAVIMGDRGKRVRALLSVWNKTGIADLARGLHDLGWELVSTGQTHAAITAAGVPVLQVSEVTGSPEILGGRVKSLHPAIHGGILARRGHESDAADLAALGIDGIDLVACNLYPFTATIDAMALPPDPVGEVVPTDVAAAMDQVDIGGPAMVRAAAKNFPSVVVVTDPGTYAPVLEALRGSGVPLPMRARLAQAAFAHVAAYDATVAAYLAAVAGDAFPMTLALPLERVRTLTYGENPHQAGALYRFADPRLTGPGLADLVQHSGDEPSYNNLLDLDCAQGIVDDFPGPAVAIVKHNNPCGVGTADTIEEAYRRAYAGDPLSAFGGVVAANRVVDGAMARAMSGVLYWVMVAPGYTAEALRIFARRQTRVFTLREAAHPGARLPALGWHFRPVSGAFLAQAHDRVPVERVTFAVATRRAPTDREVEALRMAWRVVKHVRSNASVFVSDGAVRAVGAGQMSRIDSVLAAGRIAARTAASARQGAAAPDGQPLRGTVMATDGFFADPDAVEAAALAGATAIAHPGGGRKDAEAAAMADRYGIALVTTGVRHFRH